MEQKIYDTIIVGGGPAGYTAALYAARAGLSALVLEMLSAGGQMATTTQIDNYPGFEDGVDGYELAEKMRKGAERFGAKSVFSEVIGFKLDGRFKTVHTPEGDYQGKTVILAMGASPRTLGLPREDALRGRGVSYCATCDGMFYRGKTVAVLGGGNSAAADALTLAKLCKKVYLVHRRDTLRADSVYDRPLRKEQNIEFIWNAQATEISGEDTVTGLVYTDKATGEQRELRVDGIFVAVGRSPNTALTEGMLELDKSGYIVAGEDTKTGVSGVFAAGDVRTKPLRQIITAAADGAAAARAAEEFISGLH